MKVFKSTKVKLSLLLILAIVLQMAGPTVMNFVSADGGDPGGEYTEPKLEGGEVEDPEDELDEEVNSDDKKDEGEEDTEEEEVLDGEEQETEEPKKKGLLGLLGGIMPFSGEEPKKLINTDINISDLKFDLVDSGEGPTINTDVHNKYQLELGLDNNDLDATFTMSFNFSADGGHTIKPDDYYEFTIPEFFDLKSTSGTIKEEKTEEIIANYSLNGNTIRLTFTEAIIDMDNEDTGQPFSGNFFVGWGLGTITIDEGLSKDYDISLDGEKKFTVIIKNNVNEILKKNNGSHVKNGDKVKWTVDVNKSMADIAGQTLTDSMEVIPGTVKVYRFIPSFKNGKISFTKEDTKTTEGFTLTNGDTFPITFNAIDGSENTNAYHIEYETRVTDEQRESYFNGTNTIQNNVTLNGVGKSANATLDFDKPITKTVSKTSHNNDGYKLNWEVVVNADNRDISAGVTITDKLTFTGENSADSKKMEFEIDTSKGTNGVDGDGKYFVKVNISPSAQLSEAKYDPNTGVLTIDFTPTEVNKTAKHTITYTTIDKVVDKGYKVTNEAKVEYKDKKTYDANTEYNVTTNVISKSGDSTNNIDYENNKINWNITFNGNGYKDITGVEITDTFETGKYLKMYKDEFINANKEKFLASDGGSIAENSETYWKITLDSPTTDGGREYTLTGFTLKLTGTLDSSVSFNYPTYFDPTEEYSDNNIKNNVNVVWKKDETDYTNTTSATVTFNHYTKNNGQKFGTYNPIDKTIEWSVDINYNKHTLSNAKVIDRFGHKQTIDDISKDSIKVYKLKFDSSGNPELDDGSEYDKYNVSKLEAENSKTSGFTGFILSFTEEITGPYRIIYTTKYDNQFIGDFDKDGGKTQKASNKAEIFDGDDKISSDLEKEIDIENAGKYMNKDGIDIQYEDYFLWKLKVNESQSYIKTGSTIEDTLNDSQYLVDNFEVIDSGIKTKLINQGFDGSTNYLEQGIFQIKKVSYKQKSGGGYERELTALSKAEIEELFKVEVDENKTGFKITFVSDINHEYEIAYVANLDAAVDSSLSNTYKYHFEGTGQKSDEEEISKSVTYQFIGGTGNLQRYSLKLHKKDGNRDTVLPGVKFGLYNSAGDKLIKEATADENGLVDFGEIKYGSFVLREIEYKSGYSEYFKINKDNNFEGNVDNYNEYKFTTEGTVKDLVYYVLNEAPAKIKITKHGEGNESNKLHGAKFDIKDYKGKIVAQLTTDSDGYAETGLLPPGDYIIVETHAPTGYALENQTKNITLVSGTDSEVTITNKLLKQAVKLIKVDSADISIKLEGAEFELYKSDNTKVLKDAGGKDLGKLITNSNGELLVNNLPVGNYYFKEIKAPTYYDLPSGHDAKTNEFEIIENQTSVIEVTFKNALGTYQVSVEKAWSGGSARPDIEIQLYQNSIKYGEEVTLNDSNNWKHTWANLPEKDVNEDIYKYTVDEVNVPSGYRKAITGTPEDGFIITNTYVPPVYPPIIPTTSITVNKVWEGLEAGTTPPTIQVQLYRNGNIYGNPVELKSGQTSYTWDSLSAEDSAGKPYTYTVDEVNVPQGFKKTVNGFTITNTKIKTYAIGDYTWIDVNKDGIQDKDEPVLVGVRVDLYDKDSNLISTTFTDKNGRYIFDELEAGEYYVRFTLTKEQAKKFEFTKQNSGSNVKVDSDANPATGWTKKIVLNDDNKELTKDYKDQAFKATEGIDPTWDAGVIVKDLEPVDPEKPVDPERPTRPGEDPDEEEDINEDIPWGNIEKVRIEKDVNGKKHEDLKALEEKFKYNIRVHFNDTFGYESFRLYDTLENVLEVKGYKVFLDGDLDEELTKAVRLEGQKVILELDEDYPYYNLAYSTIHLEIEAQIRKGADLSSYKDNTVPNIAWVSANNNPDLRSKTVTVTPPTKLGPDKPKLPPTGTNTMVFRLFYVIGFIFVGLGLLSFRKTKES